MKETKLELKKVWVIQRRKMDISQNSVVSVWLFGFMALCETLSSLYTDRLANWIGKKINY